MEIIGAVVLIVAVAAMLVLGFFSLRDQARSNKQIVLYWKAISVSIQELAHKEGK